MRRRFYIIFVAREEDGRLRKVPVPLHYAYVFVAAAVVGAFTITGMAGSYTRMLVKTASFNQVRSQREAIRKDYAKLEKVAHQKDVQAASLGLLASQITALYGLHASRAVKVTPSLATTPAAFDETNGFSQQAYAKSLDQFTALRTTALEGHTDWVRGFGRDTSGFGLDEGTGTGPTLWPVLGRVTSSFGERQDPFNGEGAFHAGIDIATGYGEPVHAPGDAVVVKAGAAGGYGREIILDHGAGISTIYGHLSGFAITAGQTVKRGQVIGYVGSAGRSTGPHLHYEVRIRNTAVNPHKYLRETMQQQLAGAGELSGHGL